VFGLCLGFGLESWLGLGLWVELAFDLRLILGLWVGLRLVRSRANVSVKPMARVFVRFRYTLIFQVVQG
jgi:hypothetical protein